MVNSLKDLNDFIEVADEGLMVSVQEGDYAGLINVMEFLQRVKEKLVKKRKVGTRGWRRRWRSVSYTHLTLPTKA